MRIFANRVCHTRYWWRAGAAVTLLIGVIALPSTIAAQTARVFLEGAEPWVSSDCSGEVPVVVASDAAAQSDIYSAVSLAGAVDTRCVILAGPRDAPWPPNQQARLQASAVGGYVVGGTAAVPSSKVAGRDMTRIAGRHRWATAHLVGRHSDPHSGVMAEDSQISPGEASALAADVQHGGVFLEGAERWVSSNCTGQVPVVVASDAAAQSDIYSAVTLAGAIGTHCIVLAGPRDAPMPRSQRVRMSDAVAGGYVVGGTVAVPSSKIAGRDMTRISGKDRWATAHLVGRYAGGDVDVGSSTAANVAVVAAGGAHSCGLRVDGSVVCWGDREFGQLSAPPGRFAEVAGGGAHSCGLRAGGSVVCWGNDEFGQLDVPSGAFAAVSVGGAHSCGLRTDGSASCWGNDEFGQSSPPSGRFAEVAGGGAHSCGLRAEGSVVCWGNDEFGQLDVPSGAFAAVAAGGVHSCGLRVDGSVVCWGSDEFGQANPLTVLG